ncbi:hypothetical protein [Pseudomonas soli]|uniref:hypothetical protein n=1 Tax=Pseudomonas soli TaxID=1306993 RepID=UPI0037FAE68A
MSVNVSEERLAKMAKKTFLSMWAYENPYYSQGKELCDVLVVFGNDVVVISDKFIKFSDSSGAEVGWRRWYKRAVESSISQLQGAANQLRNFPERIYSDANTSSLFPLDIPSKKDIRIHLVAVAHGCEDGCLKYVGASKLIVDGRHKGGETPFALGVNRTKSGDLVHVFNSQAIAAVFECFDTATDFVDYLRRKESALTSVDDELIWSEDDLIASYVMSQPGNKDFFLPIESYPVVEGRKLVPFDYWEYYMESDLRKERDKERQSSYVVDGFIEQIAREYKAGELLAGQNQPFPYHEQHLRLMASESRLGRQVISAALQSVVNEEPKTFWYCSVQSRCVQGLMYLWLVYPLVPDNVTDEELEKNIFVHLQDYILVTQRQFPEAKMVFGICLPNAASTRKSMVFCLAGDIDWTDDMVDLARRTKEKYSLLKDVESFTIASRRL